MVVRIHIYRWHVNCDILLIPWFRFRRSNSRYFIQRYLRIRFTLQVAEGQRELVTRLSLKNREFIANTSMDPTLSVVMSNLAQTRKADFVYDPFVGSASLLVAAAIHDAYVLGMCTVDDRMVTGKIYTIANRYLSSKIYFCRSNILHGHCLLYLSDPNATYV